MDNIPKGYCQCGCGEKTRIASETDKRVGCVKGEPRSYLSGHNAIDRSSPFYSLEDRGHSTPCWIWLRCVDYKGYARMMHKGVWDRAHRVHYRQKYGPIPDSLQLDHLCRQRSCVNPDHVEPVTALENVRRSARCKLTFAEAQEIKHLARNGVKNKDLATRFGVTLNTVGDIIKGKTWKDA